MPYSKEVIMGQRARIEFRGGWGIAFFPMAVFLLFCILFFLVFKAFEMYALAMGAFIGLLIGALFVRDQKEYWNAVMEGIGGQVSVSIVVILFVIGLFSAMIKECNVSQGFVWLANGIGISGGIFTAFTFAACCVISTATGSSIGTMFTAFPIFYPAGVLLGANPAMLAGAILSGAIFGDNLAPISDTTIVSAATQEFTKKSGTADIGGVVSTRLKYSLVAGALTTIIYLVFGGGGHIGTGAAAILGKSTNPMGLIMLLPVAVMLAVAVRTRDIFKAITVGLILGTITGLFSGLLRPAQILSVKDGAPSGFLVTGIKSMEDTVTLVISVFGIMGVLKAAGALDRIVEAILRSKLAKTPAGTEASIAIGISLFTVLFGGVTSAAMITFGPVVDEIGKRVRLHPYRRSNFLDGFANGIACIIPFLSAFIFIGTLLVKGYDFIAPLSPAQIFAACVYPFALTLVLVFAIVSGWGRRFEGEDGAEVRRL